MKNAVLGFSLAVLLVLITVVSVRQADANITSIDRRVPRVVANISLTNQTTNIPETVLFIPKESGTFLVSSYMSVTSPAANSQWNLLLNWSDHAGAEQADSQILFGYLTPPNSYGGELNGNPFVISALAETPISFQVAGTEGSTYEVHVVVERLP